MIKKVKLFIVTVLSLAILVFIVHFIASKPFRDQIPHLSKLNVVTKPVKEQILSARNRAYFITTANNLGRLGMVYHSCADYEQAALCYKLAVKKDSREWVWNYYLGYLNLEQGQSHAAIENFEQVIKKKSNNYFVCYYAGEIYQKLGYNDAAKKMFSNIINRNGSDEEDMILDRESFYPLKTYAMYQLARLYISANFTDSAEIILKAIIQNEETFGPAYRSLGNVYSMKGNDTLAKKNSVFANDLREYTPPADNMMDKISIMSRSEIYLLKQIEDAIRSGNYHWALKLCDQGLEYFPDNKTLISNIVFENFRQGNDEKALSFLNKHFEYYKKDAKELMDITDLLYNKQHLEEAVKYFNQVRKLMPKNSTLAIWLYERGKKNEAIAMMNELIKQNPEDEKILADEVTLLIKMGEDDLANKYFIMLKKLSPESAETHRIEGLMAEKQKDKDKVLAAYEAAYKLNPKDLLFTQTLIDFLIHQKNWQQAIRHFRSSLDIYPNEPVLLEGFGRLLIACPETTLKNIPEGIEYTQRAFVNYKSSYQTKLSAGKTLVTAYLSLGDKKYATKYINQTIKLTKQENQTEEYVAYFRNLISKR